MKQFLTIALVLFSLVVQAGRADVPFGLKKMNPKVEKLINDFRFYLNDAQLRVAASAFPDSTITYSWDGSAWEQELNARINYNSFGKISSMIFYIDLGGSSIPGFSYQYIYDSSGRNTRVDIIESLPGMPSMLVERFVMNYDAQGNQTSMLYYENINGTLTLSSGDSLQITYTGSTPTQAASLYWDEFAMTPSWETENGFRDFIFNANGQPISMTLGYFDNGNFVEEERFSDIAWKMGYLGFSATFGGLFDISQSLFQELPFTSGLLGEPTDYIKEIKNGMNWVLNSKLESTGSAGAISQIIEQSRDNNGWINFSRNTFTYTNGRLTLDLAEIPDSLSWVFWERSTWTYDGQGNLTEEKWENYTANNWVIAFNDRYTFSYTNDNKVYRWVRARWDASVAAFVNVFRRDYFFGVFPQSVNNNKLAQLQVYPNPVQDVLNIALESAGDSKLSAEIFNLQGQLVATQIFTLRSGKNQLQFEVQTLAKGLYQLRLQSASGVETVRFVK